MTGNSLSPAQRCARTLAQALATTSALAPLHPADLEGLALSEAVDLRQRELKAIDAMLDEIDSLYHQQSFIDDRGLIESLRDEGLRDIPMVSVLEPLYSRPLPRLEQLALAQGLELVAEERRYAHLARALTWRRCLVLAYRLLLSESWAAISPPPIDQEWLARWRHGAERSRDPGVQELWARLLIAQLSGQLSFSYADLHAVQLLAASDVASLRLLGRCLLAPGLWRDEGGYLQEQVHGPMLHALEEQGFLAASALHTLATTSGPGFRGVLYCRDKALFISGEQAPVLTVQPVSGRARRLMQLWPDSANTAYLYALGQFLKAAGYSIELGECSSDQGLFIERTSL